MNPLCRRLIPSFYPTTRIRDFSPRKRQGTLPARYFPFFCQAPSTFYRNYSHFRPPRDRFSKGWLKTGVFVSALAATYPFLFPKEKKEESLRKQALEAFVRGDYERAISCYSELLGLAQKQADLLLQIFCLEQIGKSYLLLGDLASAEKSFGSLLVLAKQTGDPREMANAYFLLSDLSYRTKDWRQGYLYAVEAETIFSELSDRQGLSEAYLLQGLFQEQLKQEEAAQALFQKSFELAEKEKAVSTCAKALFFLGQLLEKRGNFLEAVALYERSLEFLTHEGEDLLHRGEVMFQLGRSQEGLREDEKAEQHFSQALGVYRDSGNHAGQKKALIALGNLAARQNRPQNALEFFELAWGVASLQNDSEAMMVLGGVMGVLYKDLGNYASSLAFLENALDIALERQDPLRECQIRGNLGNLYRQMGQPETAVDYLKQALALCPQTGAAEIYPAIMAGLASAYLQMNRIEDAILCFEKAIAQAEQWNLEEIKEACYTNLVIAFLQSENPAKAQKTLTAFLEKKQTTLSSRLQGYLLNIQGDLSVQNREFDEAIAYFHEAAQLFQSSGMRREAGKSCQNLAAICLNQNRLEEAQNLITDVMALYIQMERQLRDKNTPLRISLFVDFSLAYRTLEEVFLRKGEAGHALGTVDFGRARALNDVIVKEKMPGESHLLSPLSIEEIQALAKKHQTTFVCYSTGTALIPNRIHIWVVPAEGQPFFTVAPCEEFFTSPWTCPGSSQEMRTYRDLSFSARQEEVSRSEKNQEEMKLYLERGYKTFIAPIASALPKGSVTIVADPLLGSLPFGVFRDPTGKYFIEKQPLSILPSLETLQRLDERAQKFAKEGISQMLAAGFSDGQLPHAIEETIDVSSLFKQPPLLQSNTDVSLLREKAQKADWVHFACHGLPEVTQTPHSPFQGALVLGSMNPAKQKELVFAEEIRNWSLQARCVFLSACHSGRGKMMHEGNVGLVWSFLAAGSQSVIATHWSIPDLETKQIVQKFYRTLSEKQQKGEAIHLPTLLQQAILEFLKENPSLRERPDLWGAFFHSGRSG